MARDLAQSAAAFKAWPRTGLKSGSRLGGERRVRPRPSRRHVGDDARLVAGLPTRDQIVEARQLQTNDDRLFARVRELPTVDAVEGGGDRAVLRVPEGLLVGRDRHLLPWRRVG